MDPVTRDFYEERRRKWRRSAFLWGFFFAAFIGVLIYVGWTYAGGPPRGPHVARIQISGVIENDLERNRQLGRIAEYDDAMALIVHIDSPGGTVAGSEALYVALSEIAAEKPVAAIMGEVAASGGYMAALGAGHIVARGNTITGSVGVIFEYPDFTELMDRVGVEMETIRSSELKAAASPFRELSPDGRSAQEAIVDETYRWFRGLVAEERGLEGDTLDLATDGRTFNGRMALDLGMIDEIGGEEAALRWLESRAPATAGLPVRSWDLPQPPPGVMDFLFRLSGLNSSLPARTLPQGPRLWSILK